MTPLETAQRYVALIESHEFEQIPDLYAPDALWRPAPPLRAVRGIDGIRAGYLALGRRGQLSMRVAFSSFWADGNTSFAWFALADDDEPPTSEAIDVFVCDDDGLILEMTAFSRPRE